MKQKSTTVSSTPVLDPEIDYNLFILQEAESGNISQKSDEEDFVKVEDLPLKLTIYSEVLGSL